MNIDQVRQIGEQSYRTSLPLVGRLLEGMYLRWYVEFASVDEVVLDLIDGYGKSDLQKMLIEFDNLFASGLGAADAEGLLARLGSDAPAGRQGLDALQWLRRIRDVVASVARGRAPRATTCVTKLSNNMLDVSGWHADLRWEPRGDSVEDIVRATSQTRDRFVSTFGEFDGSWNAAGAAGTIEFPSRNISEFVTASVVRTSGAPDPTRGFSFSLISPTVRGVYAMVHVLAGATHRSRRSASNSVTMDFLSTTLGAPPILDSAQFEYSEFASYAQSISGIWNATDIRVTDRASGNLLT